MHSTIITIGREYASGGRLIAQRLAKALSIPFYDKELITRAAAKTGLSEQFIREAEQKKTSSFLYNLYFSAQSLPLSDQVFIAQSGVIQEVAASGACVIVGRCADYVLKDRPNCLHVFVHAPLEDRMRRAQEVYGVTAPDLESHVLKHDKSRAAYYNHFTTGQWGKCQNYDLVINSHLGLEVAVELIQRLVLLREGAQ